MQNFVMPDLSPVIPEIIITCVATVLLLVELFIKRKHLLGYLSIAVAVVLIYFIPQSMGETFGGMFRNDIYSIYFKLIFVISLILSVLISLRYIQTANAEYGEYYSLLLFATAGMMFMASANDLILLYLGLELMALSTYVLVGMKRHCAKSNESALKYLLLGSFTSAMLLYGISLLYGMTTTTNIYEIGIALQKSPETASSAGLLLAISLITVAFAFKIAAVPFHMWAPDVYQGAPTSVTAFMSVGPKAAGFAVIGRVFISSFYSQVEVWTALLIGLSTLTMLIGNIAALLQTNMKRMLAYSSVAHAGYILLGIISGTNIGIMSMLTYIFIYMFMNIGAFAIIILLQKGEELDDYKGLSKTHPLVAGIMLIYMFSLTGIPPTAGFIAKFNIFLAAINGGYAWLVVIAVIASAISAYYYLRVVMYMYMKEPQGEPIGLNTSPALAVAIAITLIAVLLIGIMPSIVIG